jgi:nickel/cobalt transporter (NicO) family protein
MRALNLGILIAAGGLLLWLFGLGGMDLISHWAALQQREAQTALAAGLRAVRAGEPGAWITLMGVCASYGFFHAAGPGHGKLLIGGYGAAARVTALRLSTLAVISSLAQALTAIVLVGAGALVLGWSRARMTDTAEQVLAPASYGAIAMVGLWLAWRGLRRVRSVRAAAAVAEDGTCHSCGHAHGPSVEQVASLTSWWDAVVIVVSVAMRPCTGAVFLLILCFGLGIPLAGIVGAMVMGLGTASVTVLVAILAVGTRRSALAGWSGSGAVRAIALIEIVAGAVIAVIATTLLAPFL